MSEILGLSILLAFAAILLVVLMTIVLVHQSRRPPRRTAAFAIARGIAIDPEERGFKYEEWTLDRPDGAQLAVWELDLQEGRADSRQPTADSPSLTAVFVHGWAQSRIAMLQRVDPWLDHCERVVVYDQRGHGESEGLSSLGHHEVDDLLALLERLGEGRFVLVASSMGAGVAIMAAAADSDVHDRIVGLVTYGAYHDLHTSLIGRLRSDGYPARPFADLALAWLRLRGIRSHDHAERASLLKCPILMFHGTDDTIVTMAQAEAIASAATDATLHRVEGAAHGHEHEADLDAHARQIDEFMRRLTG